MAIGTSYVNVYLKEKEISDGNGCFWSKLPFFALTDPGEKPPFKKMRKRS
jgi:hypothetical protein